MKYILIFLLSISTFAQDTINTTTLTYKETDRRAVIAVDANVLYRGIDNKISIAVMGVDAWDVACSTSSGSFRKVSGSGEYLWNVTSASGITAKIVVSYRLPNGERKAEEKEFEIKPIPRPRAYIDSDTKGGMQAMTKEQLQNIRLHGKIEDFYLTVGSQIPYLTVRQFTMRLPGNIDITMQGDTLSKEARRKINTLKAGDVILFHDITPYNPQDYCFIGLTPIWVTIVEDASDEIDYDRVDYDSLSETPPDISVAAIRGQNILYRGINNKINIAARGISSKNITISAPGDILSTGVDGEYNWNVTSVSGNTATLRLGISLPNGQYKHEEKEFEIKIIENPTTTINGRGCYGCMVELTAEEFKNAVVGITFNNIMIAPFNNIIVKGFTMDIKEKSFEQEGNQITPEMLKAIGKLKVGTEIIIQNVNFDLPGIHGLFDPRIFLKVRIKK